MGFLAVECLCDRLGWKFDKKECDSLVAIGFVKGEKIVIAKPLTYMNLSGKAVKQLLAKNKATENDLVVIYDDIDLPKGALRVREKGSAGTHNGMRNIVALIGTQEFKRVRVGTKTEQLAQHEVQLIDFVLSKVDFDNKQILQGAIDKADDAILALMEGLDIQRVQEIANKR